jgi:hypothetical protein
MERWLNKVLSSLHLVISPRNVDHGNIKKIKISRKSAKNHKKDTKAKVDKYPLMSYIKPNLLIKVSFDGLALRKFG